MPTYDKNNNEWPLKLCKVKEAWALVPDLGGDGKIMGEGIVIAHPDTGWTNHPELLKGDRYLTDPAISRNFFGFWAMNNDSAEDIQDGLFPSHGTSTASLMISEEGHPWFNPPTTKYPNYTVPANLFVTGIAPKAKLIPLRVTNSVLLGAIHSKGLYVDSFLTLAKSIYYAVSVRYVESDELFGTEEESYGGLLNPGEEVGVISISMGGQRGSAPLEEALKYARRNGVIVCAAAGQLYNLTGLREFASTLPPGYPGRSAHTICPAGCFENLDKPPEAFYGSQVDITTPGWRVTVARTTGDVPTSSNPNPSRTYSVANDGEGTSHSTALTAGACALWQAYHGRQYLIETYGRPFLHDLFKTCLQYSSNIPSGWDTVNRGAGVLDVQALLKYPLPSPADVERTAILNNWTAADWGDQNDWGKIV